MERKKVRLQVVEGTRVTIICKPEKFRSALQYQPTEKDIFIVTYPKCGTTWMQTIVVLILRQGEPLCNPIQVYAESPFLDKYELPPVATTDPPRAVKTHLPFDKVPFSPKAKYIYVARNPKDCCVSFFHHVKMFQTYGFANGTFDDFFEAFMSGEVEYDDYFDHLLSWYTQRHRPNVLFVTYESLKEDTRSATMRVAKFMGQEYAEYLERRPDVLERVLHYSSFQYMTGRLQKALDKFSILVQKDTLDDPNVLKRLKPAIVKLEKETSNAGFEEYFSSEKFIRKGKVGDWKSYFTADQSQRIDRKFKEKAQGLDIYDLWKNYDCL